MIARLMREFRSFRHLGGHSLDNAHKAVEVDDAARRQREFADAAEWPAMDRPTSPTGE